MDQQNVRLPLSISFLQVVKNCYVECSEGTRKNFSRLGKALLFTVLICGSVLAASFCEFWLNRDYRFLPVVFMGSGLFYYILDQAIIMGDAKQRHRNYKRFRIFIALILGLFNSFLIDYYFFKTDILAARETEIKQEQLAIGERYGIVIKEKETQKVTLQKDIDKLEEHLSAKLDSLNAEANGLGGSRRRGIAGVWMSKYKNYQTDSVRVTAQIARKQNEVATIETSIGDERAKQDQELKTARDFVSAGINKSLVLLHKIIWLNGNFTNIFMSILILLVSMLLELVPLITKDFYDTDEYFERLKNQRETLLANSYLQKQNSISLEAAWLVNENALGIAEQSHSYKAKLLAQDLEHSKKIMQATELFMDELESAENQWKKKDPFLFEKYGKPVVEKAYDTLSLATEKAFAS